MAMEIDRLLEEQAPKVFKTIEFRRKLKELAELEKVEKEKLEKEIEKYYLVVEIDLDWRNKDPWKIVDLRKEKKKEKLDRF
jgi:hypothetical protein